MTAPAPAPIDRILRALFLVSMAICIFLGGAALVYYGQPKPLARKIVEAFQGGDAWFQEKKKLAKEKAQAEVTANQFHSQNPGEVLLGGSVTWDEKSAYNGYTLVSLVGYESAYLIDMKGRVVHSWNMPFLKAWPNAEQTHRFARARTFMDTCYLFPNGDLLAQYGGLGDTPYGYGLLKIDKDSNLRWTFGENAHHHFYVAENGNIDALVQKIVNDPMKGLEDLNYPLMSDFIVRLSPEGKELDRISVIEAFMDSPYAYYLFTPHGKENRSWNFLHTNSIMKLESDIAGKFPMFKAGQLLISLRSISTIAVIDPDTHKVVWAFRGPWLGQHAVQFLPTGRIMVYDNRGYAMQQGTYSKIVEIDPATLGVTWSFAGNAQQPFFSMVMGRVQRLANGNTLIAESTRGRILEVTEDGRIVWTYKVARIATDRSLGGQMQNTIVTALRYRKEDLPFLEKH